MASVPKVAFGRDVPLPPNAEPYGLVFDFSLASGNQLAANDNSSRAQNPPGALAVYGITGNSSQAAGFHVQIFVTRNGQQRQLGTILFHGANVAGTAQRPFFFASPEIIDPTDLITVEVTNLASAAADIQVVLWCACVMEESHAA